MSTTTFPPQSSMFNFGRGSFKGVTSPGATIEPTDTASVSNPRPKAMDSIVQTTGPIPFQTTAPVNTDPSNPVDESLADLERVVNQPNPVVPPAQAYQTPADSVSSDLARSEAEIEDMFAESTDQNMQPSDASATDAPSDPPPITEEVVSADEQLENNIAKLEELNAAPVADVEVITDTPIQQEQLESQVEIPAVETVETPEAVESEVEATTTDTDDNVDFASMEDLYKLNPAAFGNMPTKEFREKVKQLKALESSIESSQEIVSKIEVILNDIDAKIIARELIADDQLKKVVDDLVTGLKLKEKADIQKIKSLFKEVPEQDWFDMSPRRTMEGYRAIIKQYADETITSQSNLTKLREDFLAQYTTS